MMWCLPVGPARLWHPGRRDGGVRAAAGPAPAARAQPLPVRAGAVYQVLTPKAFEADGVTYLKLTPAS